MKLHVKKRLESRRLTKYDIHLASCEWRGEGCMGTIMDTHHIKSSYRGKRDDSAENLLGVCRNCHNKLGYNANHMIRDGQLAHVRKILDSIEKDNWHPIWKIKLYPINTTHETTSNTTED